MFIEVTPAYGRDYSNQKAVKADWADGKDFRIAGGGPYMSKRDADEQGLSVIVRYGKGMKLLQVTK